MIAVATRKSNAKITTPNEAATSHGVLPISSGRNVMAKVKDTLSFIEAARAVHGDRYDYSQTDYVGANQPIKIICKKHGEFTLAWAASHYMKKGSGCQKCSGCEAIVKGTESFVSQAKRIHGETYDYSLSSYCGADNPIVIVCRKCGPFTLAQAHSHYRKNRPCGCKICNKEASLNKPDSKHKAKRCNTCGVRMKYGTRLECESCSSGWPKWLKAKESLLRCSVNKAAALSKWDRWATTKSNGLAKRPIVTGDVSRAVAICFTWDDWLVKTKSRYEGRKQQGWDKRLRNMVSGLRKRRQNPYEKRT